MPAAEGSGSRPTGSSGRDAQALAQPATAPQIDALSAVPVRLPATLTLAEARATAVALEAALSSAGAGQTVEIDCAGLVELDSAALAVLLQSQRAARARDVQLALRHAPVKLQALAALYGVDGLLSLGGDASGR
jgi:phospholipid transport system transporter-binding protein